MKILILGGTRFLGRHLTTSALEHNHEVTLFNRGNYEPPSGVESIIGDRKRDLAQSPREPLPLRSRPSVSVQTYR